MQHPFNCKILVLISEPPRVVPTAIVFLIPLPSCKSDRLVVGYADGSLSFFSKSGVVGVASLRNCSGPIVELFRISSRCMAAVVQESLERVRLFVIHRCENFGFTVFFLTKEKTKLESKVRRDCCFVSIHFY